MHAHQIPSQRRPEKQSDYSNNHVDAPVDEGFTQTRNAQGVQFKHTALRILSCLTSARAAETRSRTLYNKRSEQAQVTINGHHTE